MSISNVRRVIWCKWFYGWYTVCDTKYLYYVNYTRNTLEISIHNKGCKFFAPLTHRFFALILVFWSFITLDINYSVDGTEFRWWSKDVKSVDYFKIKSYSVFSYREIESGKSWWEGVSSGRLPEIFLRYKDLRWKGVRFRTKKLKGGYTVVILNTKNKDLGTIQRSY